MIRPAEYRPPAPPPPARCEPAPNICARSTTAGRCSSTARRSRTSPRTRRSARRRARSRGSIDIAAAPENRERMTFTSPKTGQPVLARLADPAQSRRPARAAAVLRDLGGIDLRPDGPHARPCRRLLRRLRGDAGHLRGRQRPQVRRQRRRVLRAHARQPRLCLLRDRAAADRPQQAGAQAERPGALRRRGQGARRRHRDLAARSSSRPAARSPTVCT